MSALSMAAAVFCLVTEHVAMQGAAHWLHVRQIFPDKDVNPAMAGLHNRGIYPISQTRGFVMLPACARHADGC